MNKISIITPTYKRLPLLSSMMLLLNEQCNLNFDLIVINDDPDFKLTKNRLPENLKYNLIIINNEKNLGPSLSRNIGVEAASTDWVCFLDDDDCFTNSKIDVVLSKIESNDFDVLYNSATINLVDEGISYRTAPSKNLTLRKILEGNYLGGAPLMSIKKEIFLLISGYSNDLKALEDYELNIKIIENNIRYEVIDDVLTICNYKTNEQSVSRSIINNIDAIEKIIEKYSDFYDKEMENKLYSWIYGALAYKSLLMSNKKESMKLYFKSFVLNKNIKTFILTILCFYPRLIFKLRSKI